MNPIIKFTTLFGLLAVELANDAANPIARSTTAVLVGGLLRHRALLRAPLLLRDAHQREPQGRDARAGRGEPRRVELVDTHWPAGAGRASLTPVLLPFCFCLSVVAARLEGVFLQGTGTSRALPRNCTPRQDSSGELPAHSGSGLEVNAAAASIT